MFNYDRVNSMYKVTWLVPGITTFRDNDLDSCWTKFSQRWLGPETKYERHSSSRCLMQHGRNSHAHPCINLEAIN